MFDAGESTQISFRKARLGWNKKMCVFITHMHGDHCLGLLGIILTMSLQRRSSPLRVYGPQGIVEFVSTNLEMLHCKPPFKIEIRDVNEGVIYESTKYRVHACESNHTVPSYSYLFEERDKPGRFNPKAALQLGIPRGHLWGRLQQGEHVIVDGQVFAPSQVLGLGRRGLKIGYSGDTRPTTKLEKFFRNCDYLVFDSTFTEEMATRAESTGHCTAAGAAGLARNAGVRNLILIHFSARYSSDVSALAEARMVHDSVIAAKDLLSISI